MKMRTALSFLFCAIAFSAMTVGTGIAAEIGGAASQACYKHYLGSTDFDAFYHVPMQTREHVLDCIELFDKTGHMPSDTGTAALSKRYDAADEADSRAYEKQLTKKLGRKPTNEDYEVEMVQAMKKEISSTQALAIVRASQPSAKPNGATIAQMVYAAHSEILKTLKDPDSARFDPQDGQAYSLNKDGSLYAVCGEVNAKNGFGGYSGEQAWIYVIPKNTVYTQESGATPKMVQRDCAGDVHLAE